MPFARSACSGVNGEALFVMRGEMASVRRRHTEVVAAVMSLLHKPSPCEFFWDPASAGMTHGKFDLTLADRTRRGKHFTERAVPTWLAPRSPFAICQTTCARYHRECWVIAREIAACPEEPTPIASLTYRRTESRCATALCRLCAYALLRPPG